jgi:hypothetical protein
MPDGEQKPGAGAAPAVEVPTEEGGCPVTMHLARRCGRPIYQARAGADEKPVCLMHSRDPNKSDAQFQCEFERILAEAGEGDADFTGFVLPSSNYRSRCFAARCIFAGATFAQDADFIGAKFAQDANFSSATFAQAADFIGAKFAQDADFWGATFAQAANFRSATFTQDLNFSYAKFAQDARFWGAMFARHADFIEATFTQDANFSLATFAGAVDFRHAAFLDRVEFRETRFREDGGLLPGPIFGLARFEKPERVTFYQCFLGQALFHNCDVSRFAFSDVEWRQDPRSVPIKLLEERIVSQALKERTVSLAADHASSLKAPANSADEGNYRLIAETYHQLKTNYDAKGDPWTAGEFHCGEMEMLRQTSRFKRPWARWLHQSFGLTALYKYASHYGLSLWRPVIWLAVVLLLCMLAYPLRFAGLRPAPGKAPAAASAGQAAPAPLSYLNFERERGTFTGLVQLWGHSLMTALGVASLQKDFAYYEPEHGWGRVLALFELVLTSTLLALFLLSVRRRFKR